MQINIDNSKIQKVEIDQEIIEDAVVGEIHDGELYILNDEGYELIAIIKL